MIEHAGALLVAGDRLVWRELGAAQDFGVGAIDCNQSAGHWTARAWTDDGEPLNINAR
jgi:hypothetical protein